MYSCIKLWRKLNNKLRRAGFNTASFVNKEFVRCSREVSEAMAMGKPLVALESTIITHGMPYPRNYETAMEVEQIIRDGGATPATISIKSGVINIGTEPDTLLDLSRKLSNPVKVSRRDIPYVLSSKLDGGTTVSGTMVIAEKLGIPVFVTGGIGGVHRGGQDSMDVSADLTELGRTQICVISAGVKSILDIGRTLEFLETQGVCVATFGPMPDFPAFYTRSSGHKSPYHVQTCREAAMMIKASQDVGLGSGILIAVPVPQEHSMDEKIMEDAIGKALKKAERLKVTGKEITPIILSEVAEITKGRSLQTNIALIKNNAMVGAEIAVELCKIKNNGGNPPLRKTVKNQELNQRISPVVVGGSNLDSTIKILESEINLNGTTHVSRASSSWGGVGRNIAECLYRLGAEPLLLTAVDKTTLDSSETFKLFECRSPDIGNSNNASYTAILDNGGECKLGLGDMEIHDKITPKWIMENRDAFERAPLFVMDGNISVAAMECIMDIANELNKPVFFEPTDIRKAAKPFSSEKYKTSIAISTPNLNELRAMAFKLGYDRPFDDGDVLKSSIDMSSYLLRFVNNLFVTMGKLGALSVRKLDCERPLFDRRKSDASNSISARLYRAEQGTDVINASGAGDCFAAGLIHSILAEMSEEECVATAFNSAQAALRSEKAVPESIPNFQKKITYEILDLK